jgi:alpha-1,2-mannosyltransferase
MATAAIAAACFVFAAVMIAAASHGRGYDLAPLPTAGRLLATGNAAHLYAQDPHAYNVVDDPVFRRAAHDVGFMDEPTPFVYPPLFALAMGVVADVPFSILSIAWAVLSAGFVLLGLYFTLIVYLPQYRRSFAIPAALLVLCGFEPLLYGFWLSQTTAIIFPLVMGAVALARRGKANEAGVVLAVAAFVKISPAILAIVWLWRGPRRAVTALLATLLVLWIVSIALLGFDVHLAYFRRLLEIGRATVVAFNNHSLSAFISRFSFEPSAWLDWRMYPPARWALIVSGAFFLIAAGAAWMAIRRVPPAAADRGTPLAEGFAFLGMLLIPNIAWTHYFVFLLPVMAIVWSQRSRRSPAPLILAAIALVLCLRPMLPPQEVVPANVATPWLISGPTVAALLLTMALLLVARHAALVTEEYAQVGDKE